MQKKQTKKKSFTAMTLFLNCVHAFVRQSESGEKLVGVKNIWNEQESLRSIDLI